MFEFRPCKIKHNGKKLFLWNRPMLCKQLRCLDFSSQLIFSFKWLSKDFLNAVGWTDGFTFYGKTSRGPGFKPVYSYAQQNTLSEMLFSTNKPFKSYSIKGQVFFIPGQF